MSIWVISFLLKKSTFPRNKSMAHATASAMKMVHFNLVDDRGILMNLNIGPFMSLHHLTTRVFEDALSVLGEFESKISEELGGTSECSPL
ncbi:hypothetical protein ACTXT7_016778 [Hymenolepis weldensis]